MAIHLQLYCGLSRWIKCMCMYDYLQGGSFTGPNRERASILNEGLFTRVLELMAASVVGVCGGTSPTQARLNYCSTAGLEPCCRLPSSLESDSRAGADKVQALSKSRWAVAVLVMRFLSRNRRFSAPQNLLAPHWRGCQLPNQVFEIGSNSHGNLVNRQFGPPQLIFPGSFSSELFTSEHCKRAICSTSRQAGWTRDPSVAFLVHRAQNSQRMI